MDSVDTATESRVPSCVRMLVNVPAMNRERYNSFGDLPPKPLAYRGRTYAVMLDADGELLLDLGNSQTMLLQPHEYEVIEWK